MRNENQARISDRLFWALPSLSLFFVKTTTENRKKLKPRAGRASAEVLKNIYFRRPRKDTATPWFLSPLWRTFSLCPATKQELQDEGVERFGGCLWAFCVLGSNEQILICYRRQPGVRKWPSYLFPNVLAGEESCLEQLTQQPGGANKFFPSHPTSCLLGLEALRDRVCLLACAAPGAMGPRSHFAGATLPRITEDGSCLTP